MSEYQYYEFRALDRPLTPAEQTAVARLSSRVDPHPTRAVFTYSYSDFRGDPLDILARYYDAMFYIANWGTITLAFRFPKSLIPLSEVAPYAIEDSITITEGEEYTILELTYNQDGGFDYWIEGEGSLDALLPLRGDLMRQDYRLLYLAWLRVAVANEWEFEGEEMEPPPPPGLDNLTPPLRAFCDLFQLDKTFLQVANAGSAPATDQKKQNWETAIARMSPADQQAWLQRLVAGEPNLDILLRRHLQDSHPTASRRPKQGQRTVQQLREQIESIKQRQRQKARAAAEARRLQELESLAAREESTWSLVTMSIEQGNGPAYDEAVGLLVKLHDLARHQGTEADYRRRVQNLRAKYSRRYALMRRMNVHPFLQAAL